MTKKKRRKNPAAVYLGKVSSRKITTEARRQAALKAWKTKRRKLLEKLLAENYEITSE